MDIYALIGSSGTGKSYRALKVAYERDIKYIIDDGILIYKNEILEGISAKEATTKIDAVKRAIFHNLNHREKVKNRIESEQIKSILVLGTSEKMINQIVDRLGIGNNYNKIYINEIATKDEILQALESRRQGKHIIPVPMIEIKKRNSGLSINSIKLLFKNKEKESKEVEKTIVRPSFSYIGKIYINTNVIKQIVNFELLKVEEVYYINYIKFKDNNLEKIINISIDLRICKINEICTKIQYSIIKSLYNTTLINNYKVNIYINQIKWGLEYSENI